MSISLIIPTLNAGSGIETLLSSLSAQDVKPLEVIVIDSTSEDNTVEVAKRSGARTIVIPRSSFNHGKTRNMAAQEARGDILVFMTQDALPFNNNLLGALTAPLLTRDFSAAFGRHLPRPGASPLETFARRFNYPDRPAVKSSEDLSKCSIRTFFFSNSCSAIKREVFLRAGMFPEGVSTNEDMLLTARLILDGHKIAYVPDAIVVHSHSYSLFRLFARYYNIGLTFRQNDWILKYARSEGEGVRFMKEQFLYLLEHRQYLWIPHMLLESAAKYVGYRLGLLVG